MNVLEQCLILYWLAAIPAHSPTLGFGMQLRHGDLNKLLPTLTTTKLRLFPEQLQVTKW